MKCLHIFPNEKFLNSFIELVNKNFNPQDHLFLILGGVSEEKIRIDKSDNVRILSEDFKGIIYTIFKMIKYNKIFLHGLFSKKLIILLFLQPWLLKRCNWIVWGGDLYHYMYRKHNFKWNIFEFIRRYVIRGFGGLITHIKGDYDLAKAWYGVKGEYFYSFAYPSNLYKEFDISKINKEGNKKYIQIGNSADITNDHLDIIKRLKVFKDYDIEVICPLSYGDSTYRENVIEEGKKVFGDKFIPLTDLLPFDEYLTILAKVDIAIFNHKRQQGLGNITTLLGLGKKVYIRDDITTWDFCKEHELKVYSINNLYTMEFFDNIPENVKLTNIRNVKRYFSEEKLVGDWKRIFQ